MVVKINEKIENQKPSVKSELHDLYFYMTWRSTYNSNPNRLGQHILFFSICNQCTVKVVIKTRIKCVLFSKNGPLRLN